MARVDLVLFITIEVEGHPRLMIETREKKGLILDDKATDRLMDAVCDAVWRLPVGGSGAKGSD